MTPDTGASYLAFTGTGEPNINAIDQRYTAGYEKARHKDRAWFERYPERIYRLRKPTEAERRFFRARPAVGGYPCWMLVTQIQPGVRHRRIVYTALDSQTPEFAIEAFAKLMSSADQTGYTGELSREDMRAALGLESEETRH